jgi:CheY-like chemotaxis protein
VNGLPHALDEVEASGAARSAPEALPHLWKSSHALASLRPQPPDPHAPAGARFSRAVLLAGVDEQRLILVVEDDEATRAFLIENLTADGFRAASASGVGEGLRAIEVRQPSLVVLDLRLEDGSGLTLLDRVRAADGLASRIDPDLPVIVLSGRAGDADRVRSFARGADDHLNKPMR